MTDEPEQTSEEAAPKTDRMAKARAAKAAKRDHPGKDNDLTAQLILSMQSQMDDLRRQLAAQSEARQVAVPPAPDPSEENPPGTLVKVHEDKRSGDVIYRKVHWTKAWMSKMYEPVTFTPSETMDVLPHNVLYRLTADLETTVPSIVKAIYDEQRKQRQTQTARYAYRPEEGNEVSARAVQNPGTKQWSRMSRLGVGIVVDEQGAQEKPA